MGRKVKSAVHLVDLFRQGPRSLDPARDGLAGAQRMVIQFAIWLSYRSMAADQQ